MRPPPLPASWKPYIPAADHIDYRRHGGSGSISEREFSEMVTVQERKIAGMNGQYQHMTIRERSALAGRMRRKGKTYREIGELMGVSGAAIQVYTSPKSKRFSRYREPYAWALFPGERVVLRGRSVIDEEQEPNPDAPVADVPWW